MSAVLKPERYELRESATQPLTISKSLTAFKTFAEVDQIGAIRGLSRGARLVNSAEATALSNDVPEISKEVIRDALRVRSSAPQATSLLLAEWHGQVMEVLATTFVAQLTGRHGEGVLGEEEEAEIPIEDVRPGDLELLAPGAFFSLCISYEVAHTGSRRRYTEVVFRRMPAYRREELEEARIRGRELARGLRLE